MRTDASAPLGATFGPDGSARFLLWAPHARDVTLALRGPTRRTLRAEPLGDGYFGAEVPGLRPGARYGYRLDGGPLLPDPASRAQPEGVDGPSQLVDPSRFRWTDAAWHGAPLASLVLYELHVGTFSPAGTFDGVAAALDRLRTLGVTAVELLPVAQFPGTRNWGYDGVFPFSVHPAYGGLPGLQRLSDACHRRRLSLFVDVVYNHLGPEGNHLAAFGPYFTDRYRTPWGAALNFDGDRSDHVRRFFRESAAFLVGDAHLDGLRVDAVHAIVDPTADPFVAELSRAVHARARAAGRVAWTIAESSLNDPRVVWPERAGGWEFDALWNDDFHHALRVALTGGRSGYFADFEGLPDLRRVLLHVFSLDGRYSVYRGRRHGRPAGGLEAERVVVYSENHDQVGNRPFGERLASLVPFEQAKLAAGLTLLAPFLPMLFMGSEYGETAPFLYFTSHRSRRLGAAVRRGRRAEFAASAGGREPPDPQAPSTFARSRLHPERARGRRPRALAALTRALLGLRQRYVRVRRLLPSEVGGTDPEVLWVHRTGPAPEPESLAVYRFGNGGDPVGIPPLRARLERRLDSADRRFGGPGARLPASLGPGPPPRVPLAPWSFVVYGEARVR